MFPVYGGMNAYPYQRHHTPSSTYYHPSWEPVPPQMKEEPRNSSCTHESWPHNHGYPMPVQCHNCCNHGPHPAYYDFRPPCSHFPPPPPPQPCNHFYGGYPPYPQSSYPMYYVPPPHYSLDLPRYDYDKSGSRDQFHCCGCPNHSCHEKGRNNVKIEEQEPDVEFKRGEPVSPVGANNLSHPIVWVPSGFTMNKEHPKRSVKNEANDQKGFSLIPKRSNESEAQDINSSQLVKKPQGSVQENRDPNLGYRWFPLDVNSVSVKQLMGDGDASGNNNEEKRSGDEKIAHNVGNKDQNKQLSYPIIWVPYDKLLKGDSESQTEKTPGGKAVDGSSSISDVTPRIVQDGVTTKDGEEILKTGNGEETEKKSRNVRTIPVKQLEESAPKLPNKEEENKPSSSTKKPKLPPICLRVDPPKKKIGNGKSRSPSPPCDKKRADTKVSESGSNTKQLQGEIKVKDSVKDSEEKAPLENKMKVSHDVKCRDEEEKAEESRAVKESEDEPVRMQKRKAMSETEAAVKIQSAYRGYDVRRWDPLKKLKLIAKVREEAMEVKKNIEELDSCDGVIDEKVKTIIGETIMKLLLKLDTIQGLHECIRDVRRSLAKELNFLQEKLDSIMSRKSILYAQDTSTVQPAQVTPEDGVLVEASEGTDETIPDLSRSSNLDGNPITNDAEGGSNVSSSNQPLPSHNEMYGSECKETEESLSFNMESPVEAQDESSMSNNGAENKDEEAYMSSEQPQDVIETSLAGMGSVEDITVENDLVIGNHDQGVRQADEQVLGRVIDVEDNAKPEIDTTIIEDWEANILSELPVEVVEEDNVGMPLAETVMECPNKIEDQEIDVLSELPREVVEEDEKLAEPLMESPELPPIEDHEDDTLSELPREIVAEEDVPREVGEDKAHEIDDLNDNGEKLAEIEVSGTLKEDHKLDESLNIEDLLVINHDTDSPLDVSVKETQIDPEVETVGNTVNFEIPIIEEEVSKLQEPTGDQDVELSNKENEVQKSESEQEAQQLSEDQSSTTTEENELQVEKKIKEENEKLRKLLEQLLESGKEQQELICSLNGKVKDLEKKLAKRKKQKAKQPRIAVVGRSSCRKHGNGSLRQRPMGIAS